MIQFRDIHVRFQYCITIIQMTNEVTFNAGQLGATTTTPGGSDTPHNCAHADRTSTGSKLEVMLYHVIMN